MEIISHKQCLDLITSTPNMQKTNIQSQSADSGTSKVVATEHISLDLPTTKNSSTVLTKPVLGNSRANSSRRIFVNMNTKTEF